MTREISQPGSIKPTDTLLPSEPLRTSKNAFADLTQTTSAQSYVFMTHELQHESTSWIKSAAFTEMKAEMVEVFVRNNQPGTDLASIQRHIETAINVFGAAQMSPADSRSMIKFAGALDPVINAHYGGREERERIFTPMTDYEVATQPIFDERLKVMGDLEPEYKKYLESHFFTPDMILFLNDPDYKAPRKDAKPLLEYLAKDAIALNGTFMTFVNKERELLKVPNERHLQVFIDIIRDEAKPNSTWQHIALGIAANGQDPANIPTQTLAETILVRKSALPESFFVEYRHLVTNELVRLVNATKNALESYRPPTSKTTTPTVHIETVSKKRLRTSIPGKIISTESFTTSPEDEVIPPHEIAVYKAGQIPHPMDTDALLAYITGVANDLARGDRRMAADIQAMIESLKANPYGPGTKRLTDIRVNIHGSIIALRRLDPRNRERDIRLEHPDSPRVRATYAVAPNNLIVIDSILPHADFDSKYGGGN